MAQNTKIQFIFYFLYIFSPIWIYSAKIEDYCQSNTLNTPCITKCLRADRCGDTDDTYESLTPEERQLALDQHNSYREGIAMGNYSAYQLPACNGGINALSYSLELEFMAACWINQCNFTHDKVRLNLQGEKVGQNLHQIYSSNELGWSKVYIENGIARWFNEYKLLTPSDSELTKNFYSRKGVGHLTAMIWGETKMVGCAKMHFMQRRRSDQSKIDHAYSLYCSYYPSGNWLNSPVYENKTCEVYNRKWPHLCGRIRRMDKDDYIAPEVGGVERKEAEVATGGVTNEVGLSRFLPSLYMIHRIIRSVC